MMRGHFDYIDDDFNVRTVWDSVEIPPTAIEVVRFHADTPPDLTEGEEALHAVRVQVEFANIRRMLHGEPDWMDDLDDDQ